MKIFYRAGLLALPLLFSGVVMATNYKIDPAHSSANFVISHMGFGHMPGQFNELAGNYSVDDDGTSVKAEVIVKTASVFTNHDKRDKHLRSPDFFDAKQYPELTFTSNAFEGTAESGVLTGNLTLHGVTRSVSFDVKKTGEGKDPWGGYRQGIVARATIDRTQFGMEYGVPDIPAKLEVTLYIEGMRQ